MNREDRFVISRKPYAVDLSSFRLMERDPDKTWAWYTVDAVWFRRRRGETVEPATSRRSLAASRDAVRVRPPSGPPHEARRRTSRVLRVGFRNPCGSASAPRPLEAR